MTERDYQAALSAVVTCFRSGGKVLLCGNGGSSADCAHMVCEWVKGFLSRRPLPEAVTSAIGTDWAAQLQGGLPAIDLTADAALIFAVCNDIDPASAFAQQVIAYGRPGDVLIGISTSGNSENVCRALQTAQALGLTTIGLTGQGGGRMASLCRILLNVDESETYRVQEKHLPLYHRLCREVEEALFGDD